MKKVIAFDLDDTLAVTKSQISDRMSMLLGKLLESYDVCVITGGTFDQIDKQVVRRLEVPKHLLGKLHLMPTCGTRYYRYDELEDKWVRQYAEDLSKEQKARVIDALENITHWHPRLLEDDAVSVIDVPAAVRLGGNKLAVDQELARDVADIMFQFHCHSLSG